ncbi:AAA family ATPase [Halobacillus locisalis]|uniref:AAA family ATPase n=1 Tax=Halobacillus locisalis TaxID=220753 RepID=A0A838CV04_9BACI|nr:AAA family ATPase [Halobacillus locisalis]MBA2175972.1 AAA family ATPase [Halobacillus locisalis]
MKVRNLELNDFRKFKNINVRFGKNLTCLSGHNAVGKSTILGILANSSELHKNIGTTVTGKAFKVDLKEIMKFSPEHDPSGSEKCTLTFSNLPDDTEEPYVEQLSFRATWQKTGKEGKRYRLLPMKTQVRDTERKLLWPTFYLGLSRLYPIGEVDDNNVDPNKIKITDEEEKNFLHDNHRWIMASSEDYDEAHTLNVKNTKKVGFGVQTSQYDALANSSGQDNLGQILLALLSFKRLKEKMEKDWIGGLLLIDEIDATLHPIAQNRLFDFLLQFSKEYDVQIVFTSHSLSLLEHIETKQSSVHPYYAERNENPLSIETNYLTTGHGKLEVYNNPSSKDLKLDLLNQYTERNWNELKVYSEDEEARWFFNILFEYCERNKLIKSHPNKLDHVSVSLGKNQLLHLLKGDFRYFSNNLILLDGDVTDQEINTYLRGVINDYNHHEGKTYNLLKLPGNESPEKVLWEYARNLEPDHLFYTQNPKGLAFKKIAFVDNGPFSEQYDHLREERRKYKEWFKDNMFQMEYIVKYWLEDHEDEVKKFVYNLKKSHDFVAKENFLDEIIISDSVFQEMKRVTAQH